MSVQVLPRGWLPTPLSEATDAVSSWNPSSLSREGEFEYIDLSSVDQQAKDISGTTSVRYAEAPSRARQIVRAGDVLVSTVRPYLNGVAMVPPHLDGATASTGFTVIRPRPEVLDGRFVFQWVKTPRFVDDMVRRSTGASYPAVTDRIVKGSLLPLPPLDEQRRVAAILDEADALRAKRRAAIAKLEEMARSIFARVFLEGEARLDEAVRLGDVVERVTVGHVGPTSEFFADEGVPLLRTGNVGDLELIEDHMKRITPELHRRLANSTLAAGDLLVSRVVSDRVRCAVVPHKYQGANCANVVVIRPGKGVNEDFLAYLISSPATQSALLQRRVGSAQSVVNTSVIQDLRVKLPPLAVQDEFAATIASIRSMKQVQTTSRNVLDGLFASLQQRAFQGEL